MMVLNSLGLNGTLPVALRELRTLTTLSVWNNSLVGSIPPEWGQTRAWNVYGNNSKGFPALTFLDVGRNWLTGTLPPELANISTQYLQVSAFDNNITGTIPSVYYTSGASCLTWLAVAYNPSLFGAWPSGLQPMGYAGSSWTGSTSYTTSFTYTSSDLTAGNMPTAGTGCFTATSLGLSQPAWALLQQVAAALDPSGALLPSWRVGIQPCAPYTSPAQSSRSPVFGRSWVGVSTWCPDGAWTGTWQRCVTSSASATGGVFSIPLSNLGLNGTLPAVLSLVKPTIIDVSRNVLTGTLPPELANISTSLQLSVFDNNLTGAS